MIPEAETKIQRSQQRRKNSSSARPQGKRFRVNQIGGDPTAHQPLNGLERSATEVAASIPQENNEECRPQEAKIR